MSLDVCKTFKSETIFVVVREVYHNIPVSQNTNNDGSQSAMFEDTRFRGILCGVYKCVFSENDTNAKI